MTDPGTGATYTLSPSVQVVNGQPDLIWMVIPGKAQWLKQFFDIRMEVTNLAPSAFSFDPGTATLALPSGLSLASLDAGLTPQSLTQSVPTVPGGTSQSVDWLIRGDTEGTYGVTAKYTSALSPVGVPVQLDGQTPSNAIHIWGATALSMNFIADSHADAKYPYHITAQIKNVADVPVYNLTFQLSPLESPLRNYIFQPAQPLAQQVAELDPGQTLSEDYIVVPNFSGTLDQSASFVQTLAGTTVATAGGSAIPWNISVQTAPALSSYPAITAVAAPDGIHVSWGSVAGAQSYQVFTTATQNYYPDFSSTPTATVSGSTTSVVLPLADYGFIAVSTVLDDASGNPYNALDHPLVVGPGILAGAPTGVTAAPTTTGAALSWTAPADTGGAAITSYVVTPYDGTTAGTPVPLQSTATTYTATGLTTGHTYTFTVAAVTGNGTGPASAPSAPVTVGTALAPTGLVVTPGAGQATLKWAAPPANGVKVTGYAVTPYIGGVAQTPVSFASKAKAETVTGLTNGTSYSFTVAAVSSGGSGLASAASPVYLIGAPLAPKAPKAKVKTGVLTLTWAAPVSSASPVTGYVVTPYVGGVAQTPVTFASSALSEAIGGLTAGTSYHFTVAAVNVFGTGPASPLSVAAVVFP